MIFKKPTHLTFIILIIILGCEGEIGPQGVGLNSLINVTNEPSGENCENGGLKVESGIDSNEDGVLDGSEISSTAYVCNGTNGNNSLTVVTVEPAGNNCENGGLKVESGVDSNTNGVLDEPEVSSTAYVCNGTNGNDSLIVITAEPVGNNCENGGIRVESGIDSNTNGVLDQSEISSTAYICNGTNGNNNLTVVTAEPTGNNCENGGLKVESGVDSNTNGVLDEPEVSSTAYVCNGTNGIDSLTVITSEPEGSNCENGGIKIESGIDLNNNGTLDLEEITSTSFNCNNTADVSYQIINSFGSEGTGAGEFLFNEHIAIDSSDNIYVVDTNGGKIEKFSNDGTYQNRFQTINSPRGIHLFDDGRFILTKSAANQISVLDSNGGILNEWGSSGNGNGQFFFFRQIAVDVDENVYVVDHNNHRIQKFDITGNFTNTWGINGDSNGEFENPWGISILENNVIVSDTNGVQVFSLSGDFIRKITIPNVTSYYDIAVSESSIFIACGTVIIKTNINFDIIEYINEGNFIGATGIAIDTNDNIIVSDTFQRIITVLKKN